MFKLNFKYGIYSFTTALILFALVLLLGSELSHTNQELLTYGSMVISLSFVFFAIKSYKDQESRGILSFSKGLKIGVFISLFASFGIAIIDVLYTSVINPDWATDYIEESLKNMESLSAQDYEREKTLLIKQMEDYGHPLLMGLLMFITTFIIGLMITFLSSLIFKSK